MIPNRALLSKALLISSRFSFICSFFRISNEKDTVDDMKEAEADDPKQQGIIFYKTIGQAEERFPA